MAGSLAFLLVAGCSSYRPPGRALGRAGDEIVVAGQLFHTGSRVVLWMDPGGYDAYRTERRFVPLAESSWEKSKPGLPASASPNRFGLRQDHLTPEQLEQVRGGGWPLPLLQNVVDQFVLHFDASGTSQRCFETLHDKRCLSVHFMIDLDGTIYQTLDLKERAWHATSSNSRSVGVEIASPGAFPVGKAEALDKWYGKDSHGATQITLPKDGKDPGFKVPGFIPRPARPAPVEGTLQGQALRQYDFTPEQYAALAHLTATLCSVFPRLKCDYPRGADGRPVMEKLPEATLKQYQGLIGHYHIQADKVDPGPAFDWDRVVRRARQLRGSPPEPKP
ncbi:MAG TPA: N-acetylmuramoyl-L-alanine amidase [Verrucomicrobiales bacterium]|nr:N-acetylmuramoyl-L-alanine amidase [Verrucomicrobiales bacterium]